MGGNHTARFLAMLFNKVTHVHIILNTQKASSHAQPTPTTNQPCPESSPSSSRSRPRSRCQLQAVAVKGQWHSTVVRHTLCLVDIGGSSLVLVGTSLVLVGTIGLSCRTA